MRKTTAAVFTAAAIIATPGVAAQAVELPASVSVQASDTASDDVQDVAEDAEDSMDWGLLGLLGLIGLAGLAGRKRADRADHTTTRDHTRATRTDVNRDGRTDHRDVTDRDGDGRLG